VLLDGLWPVLQVLADDAHLMASSEDRSWSIWDVGQERVTRLFRAEMGAVRGLAMAPDQVRVYCHAYAWCFVSSVPYVWH
jgi:hypothetical protein